MTRDPHTAMFDAAITMHEMFETLMRAGFTEHQALIIISEMIRQRPETDDG